MSNVFVDLKDIVNQSVRYIDTRFDLTNPNAGREMYNVEHVEGAIYWDLEKDLSDMTSTQGRHPMISKEKMTDLVQKAGLTFDDSIVIYDQGGSPFALRAYFLLEWAGFKNVHVLREGYSAIKKVVPITDKVIEYKQSDVLPQWNDALYMDIEKVQEVVNGQSEGQLIDARSAARYRGEVEPIDPVAGHIPTAINFDWEQLKNDGAFLSEELISEKLKDVADKSKPVIAYCGSGVTAAPLYASLKEAGYTDVRLYVGSFSDWIRENEVEKVNS